MSQMKKQQSLTNLGRIISVPTNNEKSNRHRSWSRFSLNDQKTAGPQIDIKSSVIVKTKNDSTGELSLGCLSRSSSSSNNKPHEEETSPSAPPMSSSSRDDEDTGIGADLYSLSKLSSSASSSPMLATMKPVSISPAGSLIDDESDDEITNRRRTIIFDDNSAKAMAAARDDDDGDFEDDNDSTRVKSPQTAIKSKLSLEQQPQQPHRSANHHHHHVRSSSYLEVASLSSVYSNYSQFDFGNRAGAVSPSPPPIHANTSSSNTSNSLPASIVQQQHPVANKAANSSSFSTFLGLFGSKNKSSQEPQSHQQTTTQTCTTKLNMPPVEQSSLKPASNSKFEMLTSKLFNLNKSSTSSCSSASKTSASFSSSSSSSSSYNHSPPASLPSTPGSPVGVCGGGSMLSSTAVHLDTTTTTTKSGVSSSNSLASINEATQVNSQSHSSASTTAFSSNSSASIQQVPNTVLIFENRPSNLPAKSQQEAQKHRQEYEKMVEIAKKKELKEKEMKMKNYQQQIRKEDFMTNSLRIWNTEILPNWEEQKSSKRTNQLWWHGLPPPIRGKVWKLAIGNELNLTEESYYFYEKKAKLKLELLSRYNDDGLDNADRIESSSVELIKLDVSRTFPHLCFFQKDGPYHQPLHDVLGAYACYNTKIGYVQGMSFLTAILLLNMEAPDAFICLANLLNNKYLLACFCMDQKKMNRYFRVHQILFEYNIPKLYSHFEEQKVKPDLYLIDWIFTLFSKSLPLDVMSRVWDVFFRDKEEFLFRTALGILNLYKDALLELDFIHIVKFLTKLPDTINSTQLFKSIEQIETNVDDAYYSFKSLMDDCNS